MPEVIISDKSINEPPVAELHPLRTTPQGTQDDGVEHGHEHRDIDARGIAKWFAILGGIVLATYVLMVLMFSVTVGYETKRDRLPSPLATARQVPPAPYIEGLTLGGEVKAGTAAHLKAVREQDNKTLKNWGLGNTTTSKSGRRTVAIPSNIVDMVARENPPASARRSTPDMANLERSIASDASGGQRPERVIGDTVR